MNWVRVTAVENVPLREGRAVRGERVPEGRRCGVVRPGGSDEWSPPPTRLRVCGVVTASSRCGGQGPGSVVVVEAEVEQSA